VSLSKLRLSQLALHDSYTETGSLNFLRISHNHISFHCIGSMLYDVCLWNCIIKWLNKSFSSMYRS